MTLTWVSRYCQEEIFGDSPKILFIPIKSTDLVKNIVRGIINKVAKKGSRYFQLSLSLVFKKQTSYNKNIKGKVIASSLVNIAMTVAIKEP